jgi:hypothetical protein
MTRHQVKQDSIYQFFTFCFLPVTFGVTSVFMDARISVAVKAWKLKQ